MIVKDHKEYHMLLLILIVFSITSLILIKEFAPDAYNVITGGVTSRSTVNITPAVALPCNFTMPQGMNLVSFFCIGDLSFVTEVFSDTTNIVGIFSYEKGDSDPWKVYNPNLPSGVVNDLANLEKKKGYWVKTSANRAFFFTGVLPENPNIALTQGYNLVGYPKNDSQNINTSFLTINDTVTKAVAFDNPSSTFEIYTPSGPNTLHTVDVNRGYWINVTSADTWVIT